MSDQTIRAGALFALLAATISGVNTFLTKIAVTVTSDPIAFTTLKNGIVALLLVGAVIGYRKWEELRKLSRRQTLTLLLIGVIGGAVPFALFFTGLSMTSAVNGALIHKTLFLWVALLAIVFLGEQLARWQWVGVGAIFGANLLVGGFTGFAMNTGELLIFLATLFWAVEHLLAKRMLAQLSVLTVASARMVVGSCVLIGILSVFGRNVPLAEITPTQWGWTIATSVLLFGYVTSWYTALKLAPASFVATLLVPATLITNILSAIFITHTASAQMFASAILYTVGTILVILGARTVGTPFPRLFSREAD